MRRIRTAVSADGRPAAAVDRSRRLRFRFDGRALAGCAGDTLGFGADRQWRASRRPLVQISPSARHRCGRRGRAERAGHDQIAATKRAPRRTCARRRWSSTRASWPQARIVGLRSPFDFAAVRRFARSAHSGGLLLQDFHVAAAALETGCTSHDPRAGGARAALRSPDPDRYTRRYAHCDVLVIGAAPPGLRSRARGRRMRRAGHLCDEQAELGGSLLSRDAGNSTIDGAPRIDWLAEAAAALARATTRAAASHDGFRIFPHKWSDSASG